MKLNPVGNQLFAGSFKIKIKRCFNSNKEKNLIEIKKYILGQFLPGFFQAKHGGASEGTYDLKDSIEILQKPADIRNSRPLLQLAQAFDWIGRIQDLGHNQL
jgi:hypothetical protein